MTRITNLSEAVGTDEKPQNTGYHIACNDIKVMHAKLTKHKFRLATNNMELVDHAVMLACHKLSPVWFYLV